jgi:hypothetical protein
MFVFSAGTFISCLRLLSYLNTVVGPKTFILPDNLNNVTQNIDVVIC